MPSLLFAFALVACTLAAVTDVPSAFAADPLPPWRARFTAIATGCRATDPATCRDSLAALRAILPGHPGVLFAYARAANRSGDRAAALRALETYAAMGLSYDLEADSTFSALRTEPQFEALAQRLLDNDKPIARAQSTHRFSDADLLVEDVVRDAAKKRWLVSSIRARKIVAVSAEGRETDFVAASADQPWGVFSLGLDAKGKLVWAGTAATREVPGVAEAEFGRAALVAFDVDSGKLVRRIVMPADSTAHVLGDLTVGRDGTVYVTDSIGGGLYRIAPGSDSLETLVSPRAFFSPQGPTLTPDGKLLFVADYGRGIARVNVATGAVTWLDQAVDFAAAGIDGLYYWKGSLIAIQNGVNPHRVVALALSPTLDRISGVRVLEQSSPALGEPTHGAIVGDTMTIIGNSGWDRVEPDGTMRAEGANPAQLLELRLR